MINFSSRDFYRVIFCRGNGKIYLQKPCGNFEPVPNLNKCNENTSVISAASFFDTTVMVTCVYMLPKKFFP